MFKNFKNLEVKVNWIFFFGKIVLVFFDIEYKGVDIKYLLFYFINGIY